MLKHLTVEQRRLANFMSDLSEKCYSASWLINLEYILWDTLSNGERNFGQDIISQEDIDQLIKFSRHCNCWIYFESEAEETAIDLVLWKQKFDNVVSQRPDVLRG